MDGTNMSENVDKRIVKTKKNIKDTFKKLLSEKSFEKITVAEICREGDTSRITFYTYYPDKYALVEEMFLDYIHEAYDDYHNLQEHNNPDHDPLLGYNNLLEAILNLFYNNMDFFSHATSWENPYLYSAFYQHIYRNVESYISRHNQIKPKYSSRQTAALICNGIFSFINESVAMGHSIEEVKEETKNVYDDLIKSDLFHPVV